MAIPSWVRIYEICFSSEVYFLYWNGIHISITHFIFIWEWETCRSKFRKELPFPNTIPVLRVLNHVTLHLDLVCKAIYNWFILFCYCLPTLGISLNPLDAQYWFTYQNLQFFTGNSTIHIHNQSTRSSSVPRLEDEQLLAHGVCFLPCPPFCDANAVPSWWGTLELCVHWFYFGVPPDSSKRLRD